MRGGSEGSQDLCKPHTYASNVAQLSEPQKWNHVSKLTHFGGLSLRFHIPFFTICLQLSHSLASVSSFVVFLQGQDSRLHILCDVWKECKELTESLDEMCPSRGGLICNKPPNLADALWPDTQCPQVVHICGTLESSNPPDFDPPWLSRQDVSFEGESNFR